MSMYLVRGRAKIHLGSELGRGGEGAVYAINGMSDRVAKIYARPPDQRKVQKLIAMVETANPAIVKIAAWPVDLIVDDRQTPIGFVMPRVVARKDIHELYSPKSRSEEFPEADFRFLAQVASNIARVFAVVHEQGHVLGDVNHGNLLVGPDATVVLIDCDSFQIKYQTHIFSCDVGVPLFTAPELQERPFRGMLRSSNHDQFGLAVLLFHLFYMGRHPFAGRFRGQGDMPIEKAIAEYRFAYGSDRNANGMDRPPGTIPLETLGPGISQLFTEAFGRSGSSGSRPDAKKWISAIDALKSGLRTCGQAKTHHFPRELTTCPWCAIEIQMGVSLFGQRIVPGGMVNAVDVATLWRAISSIPSPGQAPSLPSERAWSPPPGLELPGGNMNGFRRLLCIGLACAGLVACNTLAKSGGGLWTLLSYGLAFAVWPRVSSEKRARARQAYTAAKLEWESTLTRWKGVASESVFLEKLKELEMAHKILAGLPGERRQGLAKLESERQSRQLMRYLDRFRIDRAQIKGIGPSRNAMLASYGIETAADINSSKIIQIPGFGEMLTSELVRWRRTHEGDFRFNSAEPVDRGDLEAMERALQMRANSAVAKLQQGPASLRHLGQQITAARSQLMPAIERSWNAFKVEEAKFNAL